MENSSLYDLIHATAKGGEIGDRTERVTQKQKETMKIVYSAGLSIKQAGELFNMPPHTIRFHYRSFRKLGVPVVSVRGQAVALLENLSEGDIEYERASETVNVR